MNDPNAEKHKLIFIKDPRAREAAMYVAAATCILGMIAIGTLALKSHSTDEGFSELYFDNPDSLPHVIFVGKGINFSFSLVSHEKTPFTYRFNVTLEGAPVKAGTISLNPQERQKINVTLMPNASSLAYFKTSGEAIIVGSPDSVKTRDFDNMSSFGYILRNGRYSTSEENGQKYLDYKFSEIEYRYKFMNISVGVSAQNEPSTGDSDTHIIADAKHWYEIHFRAITVEDIPEKFLNNG